MKFIEFDTVSGYYALACQLRNDILRKPLGLDLFSEDVRDEVNCRHFGILVEKELVAYLLIVPSDLSSVHLRQMCVAEEFRDQGLGRRLMDRVEKSLIASGINQIELAARRTAISFYKKLGYSSVSEEFLAVGIPHIRMLKRLL